MSTSEGYMQKWTDDEMRALFDAWQAPGATIEAVMAALPSRGEKQLRRKASRAGLGPINGLRSVDSVWNAPDLVERLTALQKTGKSMSQIARELGHGITRNAVISKLHRMGLQHRGATDPGQSKTAYRAAKKVWTPPTPKKRAPAVKRPTPFTYKPVILAPEDTPPPAPINLDAWQPLEGVTVVREVPGFGFCRWPIGDLEDGSFGYCGAPACNGKKGKVSSYCSGHYVRAYKATPPPALRLSTKHLFGVSA